MRKEMKIYETFTKDEKTGYELILSDCIGSDHAIDWLKRTALMQGYQLGEVEDTNIALGIPAKRIAAYNAVGKCTRTFYYDEERAYLLGE